MTEVEEETFTVAGFIQETGERFKDLVTAGSPEMAEDVVHERVLGRGYHFLPAIVIEGAVDNADVYPWIDPAVRSQDEMDARLIEMGWVTGPDTVPQTAPEVKPVNTNRVAVAIALAFILGAMAGLILGVVF